VPCYDSEFSPFAQSRRSQLRLTASLCSFYPIMFVACIPSIHHAVSVAPRRSLKSVSSRVPHRVCLSTTFRSFCSMISSFCMVWCRLVILRITGCSFNQHARPHFFVVISPPMFFRNMWAVFTLSTVLTFKCILRTCILLKEGYSVTQAVTRGEGYVCISLVYKHL
jgi:hypothetical protein